MLKAVVQPKYKEDIFAVAIMNDDCLAGHLSKEKTGIFAKIIFYFVRACDTNTSTLEITGKATNQRDREGMKVSCKLYFSAEDSFIKILKQQLPIIL